MSSNVGDESNMDGGASMPPPSSVPPGASMPPPATASPGARGAFAFDAKRWSQTDRISAVATLVLFIALFLPWFSVSFSIASFSVDGLTAHGFLYITLILCLIEIAYVVARAGWSEFSLHPSVSHSQLLTAAGALNLLLVFIAFIDKPGGSGVGWSFGAFLALIAAIIAVAPNAPAALRARVAKR